MNFKKLQQMQAALDEAILSEKAPMTEEERFNKTLVALSVEIAEVANCAEHFKFWTDSKGKVDSERFSAVHIFQEKELVDVEYIEDNTGFQCAAWEAHRLTLIEEFSDCLHFLLSLANQLDYEIDTKLIKIAKYPRNQLDILYLALQNKIINLATGYDIGSLKSLVSFYMSYVNELGITPQGLEQAYYDKNKINYERLENGY